MAFLDNVITKLDLSARRTTYGSPVGANHISAMPDADHNYLVDVIGFNETERLLLSSIFGLAARRDPSFRQRDPESREDVDIYLVDSDSEAAMKEFQLVRGRNAAPAVLVGTSAHGTGMPLLARPMQWARLLQAFEASVLGDLPQGERPPGSNVSAVPADSDKTLVLRRTTTSAPRTSPPVPPTQPPRPEARPAPAVRAKQITDAVLVVDDNATVRKFMEVKLAPYGFGVDFAETGEEAVGMTGAKEYTCIFLDVVLPGIDGYQVCKLIKSNKQAIRRTAVVMLTGRASTFDKIRGSLAGCDEYLTKPVDENRLLEIIAKFLPQTVPARL